MLYFTFIIITFFKGTSTLLYNVHSLLLDLFIYLLFSFLLDPDQKKINPDLGKSSRSGRIRNTARMCIIYCRSEAAIMTFTLHFLKVFAEKSRDKVQMRRGHLGLEKKTFNPKY